MLSSSLSLWRSLISHKGSNQFLLRVVRKMKYEYEHIHYIQLEHLLVTCALYSGSQIRVSCFALGKKSASQTLAVIGPC